MKGFGRFGGGAGMTDLRLHAILFAMVLVAAVLTWSREVTYGEDAEAVRVWDRDTTDILAIGYRVGDVEVRIERRTDQAGDYLWGTERVGGDEPRTTEFPVGPPGHGLLGRVAGLRTIRDLGTLSAELKTRFGIEGSSDRLAVRFRDENRELILGDKVYGAEQRYAHEPATGVGYILPREVMTVLANGQGAIRERWVNRFPSEDLVRVRVLLGGTVRTMARIGDSGEWADPGSAVADVAFGSFMQRVAELAIEGFAERPGPKFARARPRRLPGQRRRTARVHGAAARRRPPGPSLLHRDRDHPRPGAGHDVPGAAGRGGAAGRALGRQ